MSYPPSRIVESCPLGTCGPAVKILVVGDSYVNAAAFRRGLRALEERHVIDFMDVDERRTPPAVDGLHEYQGDPGEVAERLDGHEVLVVHGAPITADVLGAAPLRLVCCARGGPVNVDLDAARRRGIVVSTAPGRNAD